MQKDIKSEKAKILRALKVYDLLIEVFALHIFESNQPFIDR